MAVDYGQSSFRVLPYFYLILGGIMDKSKAIKYLKKAAKVFSEPPIDYKNNISGLCYFFTSEGLSQQEINFILNGMDTNVYQFSGFAQTIIYDDDEYMKYFHDRSNWCKERIIELEREE